MKKLLLTTAIISSLTLSQAAFANDGQAHADKTAEKSMAVASIVTAQEGLEKVRSGMKSIGEMVEAGKLDTIHPEIEKLEPIFGMIKEKSGLEGEKKARLESSIKQLTSQLGKLHTVADGKDAVKTKAEFKKAEGALKLLESNIK